MTFTFSMTDPFKPDPLRGLVGKLPDVVFGVPACRLAMIDFFWFKVIPRTILDAIGLVVYSTMNASIAFVGAERTLCTILQFHADLGADLRLPVPQCTLVLEALI